jgi:hypothetical protein
MNTHDLISKHEKAIEMLEAINSWERKKEIVQESLDGVAGEFPALRSDLENKIDTYDRCIKRVYQSYLKLTNL